MKVKLISVFLTIALLAGLCMPAFAADTEFTLQADTKTVLIGEDFEITADFSERVNSNTAILKFTYDQKAVSYVDFTAADGVSILSNEATETGNKIVFMLSDYSAKTYGTLLLHANTEASPVCVQANIQYVIRNEDKTKVIHTANAAVNITVLASDVPQPPEAAGDTNYDGVVNMLDLSNIILWAGITDTDPES